MKATLAWPVRHRSGHAIALKSGIFIRGTVQFIFGMIWSVPVILHPSSYLCTTVMLNLSVLRIPKLVFFISLIYIVAFCLLFHFFLYVAFRMSLFLYRYLFVWIPPSHCDFLEGMDNNIPSTWKPAW
jgi:hypothetical protein